MTKTNKTLLCALLALVLTLACALTIMSTVTTVHAAETVTFKKVTEALDDWSGEYLIVYEAGKKCLDGTLAALDVVNNNISVDIVDDTIVADEKYSFIIDSIDGGYSIQSKATSMYIGKSGSKNGLDISKTWDSSKYLNTITMTGTTVKIQSVGGKTLSYNTASDQNRFRYLGSTLVSLYKKESTSTPVAITINGASQTDNTVENDDYKLVVEGAGKGLVVGGQYVATLTLKNAAKTAILKANNETIESGNTYDIAEGVAELNFTVELSENTCAHANKTLVPATESTCITKGNKTTYYHCNDCGLNFSDEEMTTVFTPEELPLVDHTLAVDEENSVAATCTTAGKEVKKCTTVGCTYSTETVIAALGHNFDENGKCQRNGCDVTLPESMTITPADFSKKSYADNNGTKTIGDISVTINQVMQNNEEKIQFQRGKGYLILNNVTVYSIEIDASSTSNVVVSVYDTEELAKAGKGTAVTANNGVYLLNVANKYVRIAPNGTMLTLSEIKVVFREPAHTHTYKEVSKEANCGETGLKLHYECDCGLWFTLDSEGNYVEIAEADKENYIIAKTTEHSYNDGEITTAATCIATGVKTFTCTVCGETKTQEIEALGHDFHGDEIVEPATCVNTGTKLVGCTRCTEMEETELPIDENAHKWGKAAHIEGTETHKFTCEYDPTHTKIENCTYDGGLCSVCLAEKPATEDKFTIVESIAAGENTVEKDGALYVKDGSRVIVTYTITANSGVDVIEATLKQNAKFTFVSMTAGTLNNASATVTGTDVESAVKKIVVTAEKGGFAQSNVVLMTVVYELATDVAENEIPEFGIELTVLNGNTELAADKVTFTAHQTKFAVRSSELPAITVNGKTSSEEIHLTYKGEAYTSSDFAIAGRTDTPTIEWTDVANAGNYTLTLKFADNGTYGEQTVTFTVVIDKVALKASDFEIKLAEGASLTKKLVSGSVSWSEADFAVTIAEGKLVGSDTLATIGGLDGTDCTLTEARSQTLTVEFVLLSDNYTLDGEVSKQFTVTAEKTDLTFGGIAIADNASKYYDGNTENVGTITVSDGSNVIEAVVNVTITKDGAAVNEILHAGKYVITIATALTDEQKKDYEDISTTINYTVNKLTIVGITFAYDGNVVTWAATKCYGESADALVDLVAAGDVVYKVNGETVSEYKIVADGSARNYTVTLEATEDYILSNEVKTATTVDVHTVTFVDEKHTNVSKYVFDGQKVTADTPATVDGWTFNGWFADGAETAYDFSKITADVSVVARWTASVTLTVKDVYQGKTFDKQNTLTTVGGTLLGEVSGLAEMQINASWLKLEGYYSDEQCTVKVTTVTNQTNVTIYAKYELTIGLGDVDGDGNVGNSDIVLYRQYIVGGYKITVVEAGKEYEEASKTLAEGYVRFFAAVANVDGVEGSANDIRDVATLRMAMVEQDGYKVVGGAVVAPEKADSGNAETQAVNTKIENRIYALLPTTFGVGKAA